SELEMDVSLFDTAQSLLESYSPSLAGVAERIMDGYEDETSSFARSLSEEARFLVYYYNSTTLVTTGALALGIGFVILSLAFYYFYYVSQDDTSRISPFDRNGRQE
ncbi:unnamed protein product, partial [Meganyctiphanes norvegica]